ncbi:MAG: UDP-N-acetylglucosamine pyrophosphorylase [Bacilli bacterium]|nr:UDP-N-acetylglucosamine pyrophosphorylase [Bacilli bacterium]
MLNTKLDTVKRLLSDYQQEHLLQFYAALPTASQEKLLDQIAAIDFEQMASLYRIVVNRQTPINDIAPIQAQDWAAFDENQQALFADKGWEQLRQGKVAAVVVAGGQGSRLGHAGPKGSFDIGLPSHKSLFQLQAERLLNLSRTANQHIPWYIMTSPENHISTISFFRNSNYFGYNLKDIFFFQQSVLPAVDHQGKILLEAKDRISLAPSGNGDCFAALKRSGALDDMQRRGVEWLYYCNVDNALVKVADPAFIGLAAHFNYPAASKTVERAYPEEPIGLFCLSNGRPSVVEYSDAPRELMLSRDEQGTLAYRHGNISIHLFRLDFALQVGNSQLLYHAAHKKLNTIDQKGNPVSPDSPNAYKFELFVFDAFELAEEITVVTTNRQAEFAPVKSRAGADSPATARQMLFELHRSWLLAAGVPAEAVRDRQIEISPLTSYAGEGLSPDLLKRIHDTKVDQL